VRQVVNELRGEKVDVVQWRDDIGQFIAEALGPAKVKEVHIDEETKTADVVVSEHQLSLAIGKEGQNARLAARLSGYKVDIRSDMEGVEVEEAVPEAALAEEAVPIDEVVAEAPAEEAAAEGSVEEAVDADVPSSDDEDDVATDDTDDESE
jgi:N utilization substance protein A